MIGIKCTTDKFIERAKKVHGDKYSYEKTKYIKTNIKVIITCKEHGNFEQTPNRHLSGAGCNKCAHNKVNNGMTFSNQQFIIKARLVHGDKYDYSKIDYKQSKIKVVIICPIHGEFLQEPRQHLFGNRCPKCVGNQLLTKNEFIEKSEIVHGMKYNYDKSEYKNERIKTLIICPEHGEFYQTPNSHMAGYGCPQCNKSKGEEIIRRWLLKNNVKFKSEKTFINLCGAGGGLLRFDFYLPDDNICIEYDGRQHFDKRF
jgi:hypothetical protein